MLRLKQFPIRAKLFGLAGVLLAFTALIGFMSVRGLAAVDAKGGSMYRDRVVPLHDLGDARSLLGDIDSQILRSFGTGVDDTRPLRAAASERRRADQDLQGHLSGRRREARPGRPSTRSGRNTRTLIATDVDAARYEQQAGPLFEKADKQLGELLAGQ